MVDEEIVDRCMQGKGKSSAKRKRESNILSSQIDFERIDKGLKEKIRETE